MRLNGRKEILNYAGISEATYKRRIKKVPLLVMKIGKSRNAPIFTFKQLVDMWLVILSMPR
jgi:hypothetical protein